MAIGYGFQYDCVRMVRLILHQSLRMQLWEKPGTLACPEPHEASTLMFRPDRMGRAQQLTLKPY